MINRDYMSLEWWKGYLLKLGFNIQLEYHEGVHYTKNDWVISTQTERHLVFDTLIITIFQQDNMEVFKEGSYIEERIYFEDSEVNYPEVIRLRESVLLVLSAIVDPSKAPLLAGISWADEIMAFLLGAESDD